MKIAAGLGIVGLGGAIMFGSRVFGAATPNARTIPGLTAPQSAAIKKDRVLDVAISRMEFYKSGDPGAYQGLVEAVAGLAGLDATAPTTAILRRAETDKYVAKRALAKLRAATATRSADNACVLGEFDELATTIFMACDDKLFNLHLAYSV